MIKVIWNVYVKGVLIGQASTEDRVKLITEAVTEGRIDKNYAAGDLRFEIVGTVDAT